MNESTISPGTMIRYGGVAFLLVLALASCTTSRWVARTKPGIDMTDGRLLKREKIVVMSDSLTPQNPVLKFNIMNIDSKRYPQRLIVDRYIQNYRPRYGFMAAGLLASGFLIYTANSSTMHGSKSVRYTLDGVGILLATASVLNQKPVGRPLPTGESRMTKKIGSVIKIDTVRNKVVSDTTVTINAYYKNRKPINDLIEKVTAGEFHVDLSSTLKIDSIMAVNPGSLNVQVEYNNKQFGFGVPLRKVMDRYAVVIRPTASLHSMPLDNNINTLADIAYDTQLKYVDSPDSLWYKVMYGIAPSYLKKSDAALVWKLSGSGQMAGINNPEPYTGFGAVDIEQGIPDTIRKSKFNHAVIIDDAFDTAGEDVEKSIYHRGSRLVSQYVQKALGYPDSQVKIFGDTGVDSLASWIGMDGQGVRLDSIADADSTRLLVYYIGSDNNRVVHQKILSMMKSISRIKTASTALIMDVHFGKKKGEGSVSDTLTNGQGYHLSLEHGIRNAVASNPNLYVIISSSPGQNAGVYRSLSNHIDKKHSIFTYYFCKALKTGNYRWTTISKYLERNVTFTSRSLLNAPQDPEVFGNDQIRLINRPK